MFHRVDKQFLEFFKVCCYFCSSFCNYSYLYCCSGWDFWAQCFCFQEYFEYFQTVLFAFLANCADFCNVLVFLQWLHIGLGLPAFVFAVLWLTVFICSSSRASIPFGSNSVSRCVTICSYLPFSKWA